MLNFFEQPWTLIGAAVLVLFGLLTFRSICPEKRRRWQLILPVLIVAGAFGADTLVQTDSEKIHALIKKGTKAVEQQRIDVIAAIISDNYHDSYHANKEQLIAHSEKELKRSPVEKIKNAGLLVEISPNGSATAALTAWIIFDKNSFVVQNYYSTLVQVEAQIQMQKEKSRKWLINRIEILEVNKQPLNWQGVQ